MINPSGPSDNVKIWVVLLILPVSIIIAYAIMWYEKTSTKSSNGRGDSSTQVGYANRSSDRSSDAGYTTWGMDSHDNGFSHSWHADCHDGGDSCDGGGD